MIRQRIPRILAAALVAAAATSLVALLMSRPQLVRASSITRYVSATTGDDTGNDCASSVSPCRTVQRAVDMAASGDDILVGTGVYTCNGQAQVAFVDRTVTIRGGYSADFSARDPAVYPTTLDAQGQGRVVYIAAASSPTLEALRITNGSTGVGAGIYVAGNSLAVISGCQVFSNTAQSGSGGGVYLYESDSSTLTGNWVYSNTARSGNGGGIYLIYSDNVALAGNEVTSNTAYWGSGIDVHSSSNAALTGNQVYSNTATYEGGVFLAYSSNATLTGNQVASNTAQYNGGGISLYSSGDATLMGNQVYSNTANCGGVYLAYSDNAVVTGNEVYRNTGTGGGGGIYLLVSDNATVSGNEVCHNTAGGDGGGISLVNGTGRLTGNQVYSNTAASGGGIVLHGSNNATLWGNQITSNTAQFGNGGGIYLRNSSDVTLTGNRISGNTAPYGGGLRMIMSNNATLANNMVVENQVTSGGSGPGIFLNGSSARLLHTTIARNRGAGGIGVLLSSNWEGPVEYASTVVMTNTILVSQTVGLQVGTHSTATLQATLWGSGTWANETDWENWGTLVTGTINIWDDPGFVDADGGDYHIAFCSAARDAGVATWATDDVDGDLRPLGAAPDLGADEYGCCVRLNNNPTLYPTVQAAVDASSSVIDVVKVAGTCRGVQTRDFSQQVVYVNKTLTIRGGYSGDFSIWNPGAYPTTLDAQGEGRVVRISGSVSPTLEGLRLTSGLSANEGGGVTAVNAHPVISGCAIFNNVAANAAGGVMIFGGDNARLTANAIYSNSALGTCGGGIAIAGSDNATLARNTVTGNVAKTGGGGICLIGSADATLENNVAADNRLASGTGAGVYVSGGGVRMLHTTIARNSGGDGSGLCADSSTSVALTNTILVKHTVGITVAVGSTARLEATLWGSAEWANGVDWGGGGVIVTGTLATNYWLLPRFVDPDGYNYHLGPGSGAIDRGVMTSVSVDVDGDRRSMGPAPDLGADEAWKLVYLPLVLRSYQ